MLHQLELVHPLIVSRSLINIKTLPVVKEKNSFNLVMVTFPPLQRCIASNESSGIDIVVQIILTELSALTEQSSDDNSELGMLAMRLKSNASKTLLAVMESHQDMDIIDRIMLKIGNPDSLVRRRGVGSEFRLLLEHTMWGLFVCSVTLATRLCCCFD